MRYWWVNQNKTFKSEVRGGFLWSPKTRTDGARNQFYENMRQVQAGDIVFSFCNTWIMAIGVARGPAESSPKPNFGAAGSTWSNEGWLVPVEFKELQKQMRPKDHIASLKQHLPAKYSPLQSTGNGLQSVYLAEVPMLMAEALIALMEKEYWSALADLKGETEDNAFIDDKQEDAIKGRTDIGETTKEQLVKARRGQGIFKTNVRLNEKACRITGVTDLQHLRASHIKPWKDSTDEEKLDGSNGLLLAPHADHLFDKGLISFTDDGSLLVSPQLSEEVLTKWTIPKVMNVGPFKPQQSAFLSYHRKMIFKID